MKSTELKNRAQELAGKTNSGTISPTEVGGIMYDTVEYIEDVERNGSALGIRKTYTTVSAMEADNNPTDNEGNPLKKGMLVNIYNQEDPSSSDNGKVFSWQNPGWQLRSKIDAGYATREELTELGHQVNGIVETLTVYGAGDDAIHINLAGLTAGRSYILRAEDWAYGNTDRIKFQLAYYDSASNVVATLNGGSAFRDVEFTAVQSDYFFNVRADRGVSVEFKLILRDAVSENLRAVSSQVNDIAEALDGQCFTVKSVIGDEDNAVQLEITGLTVGDTYSIDAKDWDYDNAENVKFVLAYYTDKSNPIYQIYGGEAFCRTSFVAVQDTYLIAMRAANDVQVILSVFSSGRSIKDRVTVAEKEVSAAKTEIAEVKSDSFPTDSYELNRHISEIYIGDAASFSPSDVTSVQYNALEDGRHQVFFYGGDTRLAAATLSVAPVGVQMIAEGVYVSIVRLLEPEEKIGVVCNLKDVCGNLDSNPSIQVYLLDAEVNDEQIGSLLVKTDSLSGFVNASGQIQQNQYFTTDIYDILQIESSVRIETFTSNGAMALYSVRKDGRTVQIGDTTDNVQVACIDAQLGDTLYVSYNTGDGATLVNIYNAPIRKDISDVKKTVYNLKAKVESPQPASKWQGKNIVWYGTSIPAGSGRAVAYNGFRTKVLLSYTDVVVEYDGYTVANQYPAMVGSLQNSNIFNESLGSSSAAATTGGERLLVRCKGLGNKVVDICSWLLDCYIIDWDNKTFSENADNSIGVTKFLDANNWGELMQQFYNCIRISYEIAIIARYCIKDNADHESWVSSIFGEYYLTFKNGLASANLDLDYMCEYRCDVDMFVFDHGHNDHSFGADSDSNDITNFKGAYNEFFRSILRYNPTAKIVVVSDYTNYHSQFKTIEAQQQMAERWQFPFIDLSKVIPLQKNTKVLSEGYWDVYGFWHETGFLWEENADDDTYTTNASFNDYIKSDSLSVMRGNINPQQIGGKWYWETYPLYLWVYDGLHPHSDIEGRINKWYAEILYRWFESI